MELLVKKNSHVTCRTNIYCAPIQVIPQYNYMLTTKYNTIHEKRIFIGIQSFGFLVMTNTLNFGLKFEIHKSKFPAMTLTTRSTVARL